jgi:putative ABC transport system permease protein
MIAGALHLAWRYVSRHSLQSLLLVAALGVVTALPMMVRVLVDATQEQLRARAQATPLVIGRPGSATDLMLTALHFRNGGDAVLKVKDCDEVRDSGLADVIPLNVRFQAQGAPIIGTELEYFEFRGLKLAEGRMLTRLGDCVVGAGVAKARGLHPGGAVFSSPEQVFDLAGVYPLKMHVVGVLAAAGTPDDEAVFVDLKTSWLIQGIAHGHEDLVKPEQSANVLKSEAGNVVGNAAVRMFSEVTDANMDSFHFHGDQDDFPVHAAIVVPQDRKAEAILLGRYQKAKEIQMIRPVDVLESLLATLFRVEKLVVGALVLVAVAALLVVALVFGLSFRLRRREFATLAEIGVGRGPLFLAKLSEVLMIGAAAAILAWAGRELSVTMAHSVFLKGLGG